ncbi:MAG TPA: hypothetical protein VKA46_02820 [Gemmataceae bacterium]|nr:hypothetical protein [Gemmataceae bacterium]
MRRGIRATSCGTATFHRPDVAAALRQDPATAKARLIVITAYCSDEARRQSLGLGFEPHFTKPVDPDVLAHSREPST